MSRDKEDDIIDIDGSEEGEEEYEVESITGFKWEVSVVSVDLSHKGIGALARSRASHPSGKRGKERGAGGWDAYQDLRWPGWMDASCVMSARPATNSRRRIRSATADTSSCCIPEHGRRCARRCESS